MLDLFAGAGGAARGYQMAGFRVTGVDHRPMPRYAGDAFVQADALDYLDAHGGEYDAIPASPPCQPHCSLRHMHNALSHADLIAPTRSLLLTADRPYVIENVVGAPLRSPVRLCGTAFGLRTAAGAELRRHRLFETNWPVGLVPPCMHRSEPRVIGVYGGHGRDRRRTFNAQGYPTAHRREAMGIDWMSRDELDQAIPPAYTAWLGAQLRAWLADAEVPPC